MTDQDTHTATEQETALYEAMTAGDWDTVEQMRADAYAADQTPPEKAPREWVSPAAQFDIDYGYAYAHYQADHEAPEQQREQETAKDVQAENTDALERQGVDGG